MEIDKLKAKIENLESKLFNREIKDLTSSIKKLNHREKEIAHLISLGYCNSEIGKNLFIAEATVRGYVRSIYDKMRLNGREPRVKLARIVWEVSNDSRRS